MIGRSGDRVSSYGFARGVAYFPFAFFCRYKNRDRLFAPAKRRFQFS
jgi:hypothetical protein